MTYQRVIYGRQSSGIHELRIVEGNREAVDDFIRHLEDIFNTNSEETVRLLLDFTSASALPISYIVERLRTFSAAVQASRVLVALVIRSTTLIRLVDTFVQLFGGEMVRFFTLEERSEGIAWLLAAT